MVDFSSLYTVPGIPYIWRAQLQPASWRGIPFKVEACEIKRGRRTAIHAFPYSEREVFIEDLGLETKLVSITGFLVGDFVGIDYKKLIAAMEKPGPGVLVHPSLGSMTVSVVEFSAVETAEAGRVVRWRGSFVAGLTAGNKAASPVTSNSTDAKAASDGAKASSTADAKVAVQGGP